MFHRYRDLFDVPELRATLVSSVVGRLPVGIASLAILLFVQARSGSSALAGSASALYVLGLALTAPLLGRLIDRAGPRRVLRVCGILYPATLIGLAVLVFVSAHPAYVSVAALLSGASLPPISACVRALYPRLLTDPERLQTAYLVDSAVVEAVFIIGPALVAACVAVGRPEIAIVIAALSAGAGTALFMRTPSVKRWSGSARRAMSRRSILSSPQLIVVFGATLLYSLAFGLFEVAVSAHAASKGAPAAAGVALALASVGSGLGALFYGSRHWRAPLPRQFVIALSLMASGTLVLVPIDDLMLYALACMGAGIPMATVIGTQSMLVSKLSPRERLAESFTWAATCLLVGLSAGIAAGGALAERLPAHDLLLAAAAATFGAALAAAAIRLQEA